MIKKVLINNNTEVSLGDFDWQALFADLESAIIELQNQKLEGTIKGDIGKLKHSIEFSDSKGLCVKVEIDLQNENLTIDIIKTVE